MRSLRRLGFAAFALLGACAGGPRQHVEGGGASVHFIVIGDTPYGAEDEAMLAAALPKIKTRAPDFIIHVGDYKSGGAPCDAAADTAFEKLIADLAPIPVFYTPGDNEWTDCDRNNDPSTGAPYSELGRLDFLRARFFSAPPQGAARFGWRQEDGLPENATWRDKGVRFVTLHVVGTQDGRAYIGGDPLDLAEEAIDLREAATLSWLKQNATVAKAENAKALVIAMQADPTVVGKFAGIRCAGVSEGAADCDAFIDLRAALRDVAVAFGRPVLVIHGDTPPLTLDQSFLDVGTPNLWRLNAAGDNPPGPAGALIGVRDVTDVTIAPDAPTPFAAQGLLTGKAASGS